MLNVLSSNSSEHSFKRLIKKKQNATHQKIISYLSSFALSPTSNSTKEICAKLTIYFFWYNTILCSFSRFVLPTLKKIFGVCLVGRTLFPGKYFLENERNSLTIQQSLRFKNYFKQSIEKKISKDSHFPPCNGTYVLVFGDQKNDLFSGKIFFLSNTLDPK